MPLADLAFTRDFLCPWSSILNKLRASSDEGTNLQLSEFYRSDGRDLSAFCKSFFIAEATAGCGECEIERIAAHAACLAMRDKLCQHPTNARWQAVRCDGIYSSCPPLRDEPRAWRSSNSSNFILMSRMRPTNTNGIPISSPRLRIADKTTFACGPWSTALGNRLVMVRKGARVDWFSAGYRCFPGPARAPPQNSSSLRAD